MLRAGGRGEGRRTSGGTERDWPGQQRGAEQAVGGVVPARGNAEIIKPESIDQLEPVSHSKRNAKIGVVGYALRRGGSEHIR